MHDRGGDESAREFIESRLEERGPWACPDCWPDIRIYQTDDDPARTAVMTTHSASCGDVALRICGPVPDLFPPSTGGSS